MPGPSRRIFLSAAASFPAMALAGAAYASEDIGQTVRILGSGRLVHDGIQKTLSVGQSLANGDFVRIGKDAQAHLLLNTETNIYMGPETEVEVTSFLADVGGSITIGGAVVFDRPDDLPKLDLTFQTEFGEIGVRGTRFFFGPSKGKISVFVDRGKVTVSNAGVTRTLRAGDGTDLEKDKPPSEVSQWKAPRIEAAFALVGLTR